MKQVVKVDVRTLEKAGYMVQRRHFWHYAVVSLKGKNVIEAIILPNGVVTLNEDEFQYGSDVLLTVEDGKPTALLNR